MADIDYEPITSPEEEEEEERRRRLYDSPYPGVELGSPSPFQEYGAKSPGTDASLAVTSSAAPAAPSGPPPVTGDSYLSDQYKAGTVASPSLSPARARLKTLTDQGAPAVQPLHSWKKGLDIAAKYWAPGVEQSIRYAPQRDYQANLKQAESDVAGENVGPTEDAALREKNAKASQEEARAEKERRPADPKVGLTPEELTIHDLMTGENGQPRVNPETQKPYDYLSAYQRVKQAGQDVKPEPKQNDFEQFYTDYIKDNNIHDSAHNRLQARKAYAAAGQAPQHDQRQLAVGPDGTVIELRPGMKVPQGSKTMAGDLATGKPTADEQRRADLAENLNENFDQLEEIIKRRPDLFGPLSGRMTSLKSAVGSSDPDVAALNTIKHQIGMAQISAHGMRSAHGIDAAAESIMNSFNNSGDAVLGAVKAARNSVKTFSGDVERAKGQKHEEGAKPKNPKDPAGIL